uniref:Velvet domain-containing protein n=2 Tax=Coccidioides posadasii TaxID=199306 RepID=A0A0J6EU40_COCPO|nr:hypothetical protein CPAG_00408 [Coccidioides posadasii RMSCC 3488]
MNFSQNNALSKYPGVLILPNHRHSSQKSLPDLHTANYPGFILKPSLSRANTLMPRISDGKEDLYLHEKMSGVPSRPASYAAMPPVPSGFSHLLNPSPNPPFTLSRLRLFVRQQPAAARTCAAGDKSRRSVDPSPILQLLMTDFDSQSEEDIKMLKHSQHVVACHLFAVCENVSGAVGGRVADEVSHQPTPNGQKEEEEEDSIRNVYGKTYVSPFFVEADPEPSKAPSHPGSVCKGTPSPIPSTFFVFADLRIPTAGVYRLRFRLINVGEPTVTGKIPILHEVWSDSFRAFASKDFPGMRPTPYLSEKLKALGADGAKSRKAK